MKMSHSLYLAVNLGDAAKVNAAKTLLRDTGSELNHCWVSQDGTTLIVAIGEVTEAPVGCYPVLKNSPNGKVTGALWSSEIQIPTEVTNALRELLSDIGPFSANEVVDPTIATVQVSLAGASASPAHPSLMDTEANLSGKTAVLVDLVDGGKKLGYMPTDDFNMLMANGKGDKIIVAATYPMPVGATRLLRTNTGAAVLMNDGTMKSYDLKGNEIELSDDTAGPIIWSQDGSHRYSFGQDGDSKLYTASPLPVPSTQEPIATEAAPAK